jgi:hypothetical protein
MVDLAAFLWLIASLFVFLAIVRITTRKKGATPPRFQAPA